MIHSEEFRQGQRPRDLGVLKGDNFTTAIVTNRNTDEQMLMVGIQFGNKEVALPMNTEEATAIAHNILKLVREIKASRI